MYKKMLLCALIRIRDEGPVLPNCGICGNVSDLLEGQVTFDTLAIIKYKMLNNLMLQWPSMVQSMFPVSGMKGYLAERNSGTVWDNPRRHELLAWLIEQLEADND